MMMMMTSKANSLDYSSPRTSTSEATCNICNRLLYPFEEVLRCRICYGAYHWRCLKPQRISRYGQNDNYICMNCSEHGSTVTSSSHRSSNELNQTESFETHERDYNDGISRRISEEVHKPYDEKQSFQTTKTNQRTDFNDYSPSHTNGIHYQQQNSQYSNENRIIREIEQNGIESDEENERRKMFQADYQYTPLKDYAVMRNQRINNDLHTNSYQNSSTENNNSQPTSRYGGGSLYSDHGYDPTVNRLVEIPSVSSTSLTSPTMENFSINPQQNHFISTTSLKINEKPIYRSQQLLRSPYSPPNHENDSSSSKFSPQTHQQQNIDRQSNVGSDSGIVTIVSNSHPTRSTDENHVVEKKITNLVQQLGKQLENDAQKLNEKLELKLKNLENMINQQTYIIRKQDEVIEQLKDQIHTIETERDHFRQQLSLHEQREQNEKKKQIITSTNSSNKFTEQDKKYYNVSPTINDKNKSSTKKTPAPRIDNQWSSTDEPSGPAVIKLIQNIPINRERSESNYSSSSSSSSTFSPSSPAVVKLVSSVPIIQTPTASNRLDDIIHQSNIKDTTDPSTQNYNLAQVRTQARDSFSQEQRIISSIHHEDNHVKDNSKVLQQKRSSSTSSSSSSSKSLPGPPTQTDNRTSTTITTNRNPNKYPSFESLQQPYQTDQISKLSTKTTSLQFGIKPVHEEPGSTSTGLEDSNQPNIQSNTVIKGWLRKQNRESFLKRIERYYCILKNNTLYMHRHNYDQTPKKVINLKGAKVLYYDDSKYGPSLELTWTNQSNHPKHYHLYASNPQEAEQWSDSIQTVIHNLENKNKWQQYRMNT